MTVGATEAIAATVLALVQPGDEVVTFEPYYDSYAATIALAGGVRRTSVLRFPDFAVDEASLRAAFSSRTRLVLLNTPHNPTGKVFTRAELELVCALAREHDAWVVTDEVYEHLVFDGAEHVPVATPAGHAGAHPDDLVGRQDLLHHRVEGRLGVGARRGGGGGAGGEAVPHLRGVRARSSRRSRPGSGCRMPCTPGWRRRSRPSATGSSRGCGGAGMAVSVPRGTYFVIADAAPLGATDALAFCHELPARAGVVGVPVSVFHDDVDAARTLVRFAFCKRDDVLDEACRRLAALRV